METAVALGLILTYALGVGSGVASLGGGWTAVCAIGIAALVLVRIRNQFMRVFREFYEVAIPLEAKTILRSFVDEALILLNKDRKEDLKALLLKVDSDAEEDMKEIMRTLERPPIEVVEDE
jgi:hypothetical protein